MTEQEPKPQTKAERDEAFKEAVFKELDEVRKQNAMLVQATAQLAEKVANLSAEPEGQGKGIDPITALILRGLMGEEKKADPVEMLAKQTENLARIAESVDRIRSPMDVEGMLAKRLLWRQGLRATGTPGLPRYMTKEELKRYDKVLNRNLGLEEWEEEGQSDEHVKG